MSQAIVGRVFWKEARIQRAFWWWILGLGVFVQLLPLFLGRGYYRSAVDVHWFYSVNVVIACCFAVGSTAIAFAGETENRTKSLFQRLPLRTADLLVGKLGWSVLGTYTLLLILALSASVLSDTWGDAPTPHNAGGLWGLNSRLNDFRISLLSPLPFLVIGVFCSLGFRDVLTTVAVAGVATAFLLGAVDMATGLPFGTIGGGKWFVLVVILGVVAVGDGLLVPYWIRDSLAAPLSAWLPRFARSRKTAPGHSTLSVRSVVAWKRTASSLLWKELRQAKGLTLTVAGVGALLMVSCAAARLLQYRAYGGSYVKMWFLGGLDPLLVFCLTTAPLFFGIAACRADRRDGAYRLLANRGVSPNALWLTKHAVWLGLAIATVLWFLGWEQLTAGFETPGMPGERLTLWSVANDAARATFFGLPPAGHLAGAEHAEFAATLGILLFVVVLLYALGHLLSLVIPSALTALVLALIGWAGIFIAGAAGVECDVPFWWTIGLLPAIFLFAGWLRTRDWLVDRNSLAAWGRVAASVVVPVVAIWCAVAIFRVVEIPPTSLPLELTESQPRAAAGPPTKQSLFVDALKAFTPRPPRENRNETSSVDDWAHFDAETKTWVEENEPARKLALEAAQKPPGDFQELNETRRVERRGIVVEGNELANRVYALAMLLLESASKLESQDQLEKALEDYVAAARLGDDLGRSNRLSSYWGVPATRSMTLAAMDRWAIHPKQTPELIKRAIGLFRRFDEESPLLSARVLVEWRLERQLFEDFVWKGNNPNPGNRTPAETGIVRWCLPWELLRLQRVQDAMFSRGLDEMQLVERDLHDRGFVNADLITADGFRQLPWKWQWTTLEPPIASPNGTSWMATPTWRVNQAALSDLHFVAWAAADYRRAHKKLPGALSELVPPYFGSLPVDPWTGREFLYEPKGVPARLHASGTGDLDENQPFVASAGASDCRIEINSIHGESISPVRIIDHSGTVRNSISDRFVEFPAPALAIPSLTGRQKSADQFRRESDQPRRRPADRPPVKPVDNLLAKPGAKPSGGKTSPKK
ncbi:MAG TPA: hypothetical protein VG055_01345 [Planctomycetaceae bacterium]|jgi:hypothetical protein|nr:hypothetical protein [Planctomycetaceae bacterium]